MTNLTISLDDAVVKQARIRAIQDGSSVSAKVREFLADYARGSSQQRAAGQAFVKTARASKANSEAVKWVRQDAYDRTYP